MDFPKYVRQHSIESESYAILLYYLRKLGIFRNLTNNDYGIDFELEICDDEHVTGKFVKIQVKGAQNLKIKRGKNAPSSTGIKQSTLYYWTEVSYQVNVLVFIVDINTEKIYWTGPIFWQAVKLIDNSNKTKTINYLPKDAINSNFARVIKEKIINAPNISEIINSQLEFIRNFDDYLYLYFSVFINEGDDIVKDSNIFKNFLNICKKLLWDKDLTGLFENADDGSCFFIYDYWKYKDDYGELVNRNCQIPMKVLMPKLLKELILLRSNVLESWYYWDIKNKDYLEEIYLHDIPHEMINRISNFNEPFKYSNTYKKNKESFSEFLREKYMK